MPTRHFMVRVEPHSGIPAVVSSDQVALDVALAAEGFTRRLTGTSGTEYHLPTGEYIIVGELTRQEVLDRVKRAAAGRRCAILVTQGVAFVWAGLAQADPVGREAETKVGS